MSVKEIGSLQLWLAESQWRSHEATFQWAALILGFVLFSVWETFRPHRGLVASAGRRWTQYAILSFLVNSPLAWLYPISAMAVAVAASHSRYGLLNHSNLPIFLRYILAVLLLDLVRYGQHRLYHSVPFLWRIHRVHHADPDCDWSTSLLFHPGEVIFSQASYLAIVAILAPPPLAVLGLEIASIMQTMFEHANVALPRRMDAVLRRFIITPDVHRIHHADQIVEQNANFGTLFSWWDFCFKTYLPEPTSGQHLGFGLPELDKRGVGVLKLLALPFRKLESHTELADGSIDHPGRTANMEGGVLRAGQ